MTSHETFPPCRITPSRYSTTGTATRLCGHRSCHASVSPQPAPSALRHAEAPLVPVRHNVLHQRIASQEQVLGRQFEAALCRIVEQVVGACLARIRTIEIGARTHDGHAL